MAKQMHRRASQFKMRFSQFSEALIEMKEAGQLPEVLASVTVHSGNSLAYHLSPLGANVVDWRDLLLLLCEPFPQPSMQDLLRALQHFAAHDHRKTGLVTRQTFRACDFWFRSQPTSGSPVTSELVCSSVEGSECNRHRSARIHTARLRHLDDALFDIFATKSTDQELLDYVELVSLVSWKFCLCTPVVLSIC